MAATLKIKNYKSIIDLEIELGRFNVFIGENGCGKSNILEAVCMLSAARKNELNPEALNNRGIRVAKPNLTYSSFLNKQSKNFIDINYFDLDEERTIGAKLYCDDIDNIYSNWSDRNHEDITKSFIKHFVSEDDKVNPRLLNSLYKELEVDNAELSKEEITSIRTLISSGFNDMLIKTYQEYNEFLIYSLNSSALRGISNHSKKTPLGIYGEGLDVLLGNLEKKEFEKIKKLGNIVPWLKDIIVDKDNKLNIQGFKMGRSSSKLYFKDRFMGLKNNIFSAENANEGALFILFYIALFISSKTPNFFAIDNIETALNPKLCRDTIKLLNQLAKENNKKALITTHNPAVLDGLNLNDEEQRLFVVKRTNEGFTKVERIKLKPQQPKGENLKLSEMWMRGYIGGLSSTQF